MLCIMNVFSFSLENGINRMENVTKDSINDGWKSNGRRKKYKVFVCYFIFIVKSFPQEECELREKAD